MFTLMTKNATGRWTKTDYSHKSWGAVQARKLKETRFGNGAEYAIRTPEGKLYKAGI